jgi:hypothetical protein
MGGAPIASRLLMFFVQENVRMRYVKINRKGKTFRHWVADSVEIGFAVWCLRSWTMMLFDFFCVCGVECMMHSTYNTPLAFRWLLVTTSTIVEVIVCGMFGVRKVAIRVTLKNRGGLD